MLQSISAVAMTSALSTLALATEVSSDVVGRKTRQLRIDRKFILFPINNDALPRHVRLMKNGKALRDFNASLGLPAQWWAHLDVSDWQDQELTLSIEPFNMAGKKVSGRGASETDNADLVAAVHMSADIWSPETLYKEALRPQFHFSTRRGWLNDPHVMFYKGEYHLFYQHNPYGWSWGNGHWGHAVSTDLVHWKELPIALYPEEGFIMQSGSAVVDWNNSAGFQTGEDKTLAALYTTRGRMVLFSNQFTDENDTPPRQELAFSNDRGRTWKRYKNNPVIPHIIEGNRDPHIFWYEPEKKWVMALYMDKSNFWLFSSKDLKKWEKMSEITLPGDIECPELFEIAIDGDAGNTRWIFFGARGLYQIGKFNGRIFTPESGPYKLQHGNCWYAGQRFRDIPAVDGRCIIIPWGAASNSRLYADMPFNQAMGIPVELALRPTADGLRLFSNPVKELTSLRTKSHSIKPQILSDGLNPLASIGAELFELTAEIGIGGANEVTFDLRGVPLIYDVGKQELSCSGIKAPLGVEDGKIQIKILVDRTTIDIFGNNGRLYMPMAANIDQNNRTLGVHSKGPGAQIENMDVFELKSSWERKKHGSKQ